MMIMYLSLFHYLKCVLTSHLATVRERGGSKWEVYKTLFYFEMCRLLDLTFCFTPLNYTLIIYLLFCVLYSITFFFFTSNYE